MALLLAYATTTSLTYPLWKTAQFIDNKSQELVPDLVHTIATTVEKIDCDELGDFADDCASLQLSAKYTLGNFTELDLGKSAGCVVDAIKEKYTPSEFVIENGIPLFQACETGDTEFPIKCMVGVPFGLVMAAAGENKIAQALRTDINPETAKKLVESEPIKTFADGSKGVMCSLTTMVLGLKEGMDKHLGGQSETEPEPVVEEEEQQEESGGLFGFATGFVGDRIKDVNGFVGDIANDVKHGVVETAKVIIDANFKDAAFAASAFSNNVLILSKKINEVTCN